MVFDPEELVMTIPPSKNHDWSDFYPNAKEDLPPSMPTPRAKQVSITFFCDANHAGDMITRRSQSGIIFYMNGAPITWYSKRQNTVESSTFGSEFIALRIGTEILKALRYKLRMMGIPLSEEPSVVWVDNIEEHEEMVRNSLG